MRLGFYLTGSQPIERVLPLIARAALGQGQRLLVVAQDSDLLARIDRSLWENPADSFLPHGQSGQPHDKHQPVLLSQDCVAANDAEVLALADGQWRKEAENFARVLLFFDDASRAAAREVWRQFDAREDVERDFHELEGGKWVKRA